MSNLINSTLRGLFRFRKWWSSFDSSPPNYVKMRRFNFTEKKVRRKYGDRIQIEKMNGHAVYTFQPEFKRTLIWFHGGGYVRGPISLHFSRWIQLCEETKSRGILLDYPKAPEYCHLDTKTYLEAFTGKILNSLASSELYFVGDSAGGGLALAYALSLQKNGLKTPDATFLFSPWLDLSFSQSNIQEYAQKDAFINQSTAEHHAHHYARGENLQNEWISPLFSSEKKISFPLHIYSTPDEILHGSVLEFKRKFPETILHTHERLFHAWPIMPLKESNQVIEEVTEVIKARTLASQQIP